MSKLVEALGIMLGRAGNYPEEDWVISERELESALEKLPVVYGRLCSFIWFEQPSMSDTHKCRLICIEEIKREPFKSEIESISEGSGEVVEVPEELKGKRFKVTFEEVR